MARMEAPPEKRWRTILPWVVSACLLAYVFGWATDWQKLQAATEQANLPLFVFYATLDRLETKGLISWATEESTPSRGGHPRRCFAVTARGIEVLQRSQSALRRLWDGLDGILGGTA